MKTTFTATAIALAFLAVSCSKTVCTEAPKEQWQDQEAFQEKLVEQGYKINEFKVTDGNCYEIYGWDAAENKVEIYFNPVDGSVVKEEKH